MDDETATYRSLANKMSECYNIDPSDSHSCDAGSSGEPWTLEKVHPIKDIPWEFSLCFHWEPH